MFFSRKYKNPKNTDIKILRAYLKQVSAYAPLPPTGKGFKDLTKHESIFSNILGSMVSFFFPCEAGASQTIAFPSRSLGTRGKSRR
ncbi:hypothetical protein KsCSTR_44170 [Candidatus Kuenenia stuttgartiensis]|uniref:Uncharacterized protein n=1 Tax=Kuenenia stuttgartiensis TaxID=174633 RepID=Q1PWT1_KUEST|nr:hypothetical protein KsCSTR_44170 [Candidatus Kuenenia stuttgartiensis]CAJ71685.1 unknown protein [Candidatus Kuenenia stuttgartiensis]